MPSLEGRGDRVSGGRVISAFSSTRAVDITVRWLLSHLYILLAFYSSCAHAARAHPLSGATKDAKRSWGFGHGSSFSKYTDSPPPSTSLGSAQQSSFTKQSDVRNILPFRQVIPALRPLIPQRVRLLFNAQPYLIVGRRNKRLL